MDKKLLPPPLDPAGHALFLDYDGTLVDLAPTPAEAMADRDLVELLGGLHGRAAGALAIVTGRPVADIDGFLAPLRLTVAALHGLAVRRHDGTSLEAPARLGALDPVRNAFATFAVGHPGTQIEDKGLSVALHFRAAPAAAGAAEDLAQRLAVDSEGALRLQRGKMVVELLPAGTDKGTAITRLMREPPYRARRPVFVGDDVTDEAGFGSVNALGGVSVRIGHGPTTAGFTLPDVAAMRAWLGQALAS